MQKQLHQITYGRQKQKKTPNTSGDHMRAGRTEVLALAHPPFASDVICRDPPDDHRLYANQDKGHIPRCYQLL
jgi:hypothetical protein